MTYYQKDLKLLKSLKKRKASKEFREDISFRYSISWSVEAVTRAYNPKYEI